MSSVASAPRGTKISGLTVTAWDLWVLGLPLLAMSPMLLFQWQNLMSRPERQFFPALVVLALYFPLRAVLSQQRQEEHKVSALRLYAAVASLQLALVLYGLSVWAFSPWLAHLAVIGIFFAWALVRCTESRPNSVLAWTGLLVITLPLPLNYDARLVSTLQTSSSWACSMALDALKIPHLRLANVIEMRDRQFFIEEACSGIGSMYALLAVAALLLLLNRRSLLIAIITLLSVPVWAMLGNFLRLLSVTLGHHYYARDLSHGMDHELLGLITFGIAALGLWVTEWIVANGLQPIPPVDDDYAFMFRTVNAWLNWPHPDPFIETVAAESFPGNSQPSDASGDAQVGSHPIPLWEVSPIRWLVGGGATLALILGVAPAVVLMRGSAADVLVFHLPEYTATDLKKFPGAEAMPERLGQWQRVGFTTQQRSTASLFGAHSLIWEYAHHERRILVSLDFPFRGPHPLEYCYQGSGWNIDEIMSKPTAEQKQWEWRELSMSNDLGAKALVYYSVLTEKGQTYSIAEASEIGGRFRRTIDQVFSSRTPAYQPVCYQVQVLYEGGTQLTEEERSELRESFLRARTELLSQVRTLP